MVLNGWKTYVVMIAAIMFAVGGMITGKLDYNAGIALVLGALGLGGLRSGINK